MACSKSAFFLLEAAFNRFFAASNSGAWIVMRATFWLPLMLSGSRTNRQKTVPATIVQNQGVPVETCITSKDHRMRPAGVQLINPKSARSPYCKGEIMSGVMISVTELGGVSTDDARPALLVNGSLVSAHMVSGSAVLVA